MEERFLKTKMENALVLPTICINFMQQNQFSKVVWGYRAKPKGIPKRPCGDIFVSLRTKM